MIAPPGTSMWNLQYSTPDALQYLIKVALAHGEFIFDGDLPYATKLTMIGYTPAAGWDIFGDPTDRYVVYARPVALGADGFIASTQFLTVTNMFPKSDGY